MTNEKAIEELKAIKSAYSNKAFEDSRLMRSEIEALEMAIVALKFRENVVAYAENLIEQDERHYYGYVKIANILKAQDEAEQEPSGDLISREAVEEIINDIRDCISVEGYWAILERLKRIPPVNPQEPKADRGLHLSQSFKDWQFIQEPKTGHWIKGDIHEGIYCSECETNAPTDYDFHYIRSNYCPNCGARMEGVEE